ncbi:MAG: ornithine carbamoyltransferase [Anaerosomatales bacterium]|nr:ornithine carbamoyltransferase [Anaerosomatales bacterium]
MQNLMGRDLLTLGDLTPEDLEAILIRAKSQKLAHRNHTKAPVATGKSAALIFMKPSLRTRASFELACRDLGIHPMVMGPADAFSRNETVHDTVKVLERYVQVIVLRTFAHAHVEEVAEHASVPVINALTDDFHPCQVLADLLTIKEHKGSLAGLRLAYIGDGNNMAHSLMLGGALAGMQIAVATPAGFEPQAAVVERARAISAEFGTGGGVTLHTAPTEAVAGADVVVTDTWASMGQEAEHDARVRAFAGFTVDAGLMGRADSRALFMHCLPAHRGEEVTDEVIDGPQSVVFDEAENRLHAQRALLSLVL